MLTEVVPEWEDEMRVFDEDEGNERLYGWRASEDGWCHERTGV